MKRIAFVIPNLCGGGAARVASTLCSRWADLGREVHLLTFEEEECASAYPLRDAVVRHRLGLFRSAPGLAGFISTNTRRFARLRATLQRIRPDVVVAFLVDANIPAVVAARSLGIPVIISERNHPAHYRISLIKNVLRSIVYPRASRLCVQTGNIAEWFRQHLNVEASIIPNPVEILTSPQTSAPRGVTARRRIISLGRLEPQKGYDRLIDAFAMIAGEAPEWDLLIFGEGELRPSLEQRIRAQGLAERIKLPGVTRAPQAELLVSDLYVHPARYEGFPNAVAEALATGLCVVATDCPGAIGELLQGGEAGVLVTNRAGPAELAEGLRLVLRNEGLRAAYGAAGRKIVQGFSVDAVARAWLHEFQRVGRGMVAVDASYAKGHDG